MRNKYLKYLIMLLFITIFLTLLETKVMSNASTGHADFRKIDIPYSSKAKLIINMSSDEIKNAQKKVKRRLFGWNVYSLYQDIKITYIGQTIFSKANRTAKPISLAFSYAEEETLETSINTTGDIGLEAKGKILQVTAGLDFSIRKQIGQKTETFRSEDLRFTVVVNPNRRISLTVKGDAILNNGAGKYFFFGITFKKGTWEYIDIVNEYYEFYEETLY